MSERLISSLMVIAAVYGGLYYLLAEKDLGMAVLFAILAALGFYAAHVTWTAPVFAEDMPAADLKQVE